ncbi:hypothetical protein V4100_000982 [Pseudomonas aeruginosa]
MIGLTRETAEKRRNRASIKAASLISYIEQFIDENANNESFLDDLYTRYQKPVQEIIEQALTEQAERKDTFDAILMLQGFWSLGDSINKHLSDDSDKDPFFVHVGCIDGMSLTYSFSKKELKEYELSCETEFYKIFDDEPDDIEFSEYPLAVMLGRVEDTFNIIKNRK